MLFLGSQSKFLDVDLSVRGGTYSFSNSFRYEGAVPCKHLYASSRILNSVQLLKYWSDMVMLLCESDHPGSVVLYSLELTY